MLNTPHAAARQVLTGLTDLGATIPQQVQTANARAVRILTGSQRIAPPAGALAAAVADALDHDRDPATDKTVQRILSAQQLTGEGVQTAVTAHAAELIRQAMTEHAGELFDALRRPFAAAADTLTEAHRKLGGVPLDDPAAVVSRGGDAAAVWGHAQQALARIEQVVTVWHHLATVTRAASLDWPTLRLTAITHADWTRLQLNQRRLNAWELLGEGFALDLAGPDEHRARRAVILRGEQDAAAARANHSPDRRIITV